MGKLRFSEEKQEVFIVPRLDDDQIDDLFYQEDEIGEMRHTAFMIECGLEEDPPDGPDVPPVPWGDALIAQQRSSSSSADSKSLNGRKDTLSPRQRRNNDRPIPSRSRSSDEIDELEEELSPHQSPRRRLVAAKSGSLHGRWHVYLPIQPVNQGEDPLHGVYQVTISVKKILACHLQRQTKHLRNLKRLGNWLDVNLVHLTVWEWRWPRQGND